MDRRHFVKLAALLGLSGNVNQPVRAETDANPALASAAIEQKHLAAMQHYDDLTGGATLKIGMLLYPGMFMLDLAGPLAVFEAMMNRDIHLLWKNLEPVGNENPAQRALVPVTPTTRFADSPEDLDVLFVPGGVPGTLSMMEDPEVLAFLAARGQTARYITSVCTGSLILGAAGLLKGYRATSHWLTRDLLAELGAIPAAGRIVVDRNRITGGGVPAGIDFALHLVALLRGEAYAQAVQLYLEYDPAPPFNAGSPEHAPRRIRLFLEEMFAGMLDTARSTAIRAFSRLG